MRLKSTLVDCLGFWLVLSLVSIEGHCQGSTTTQSSVLSNLSTVRWDVAKLRQKWEKTSTEVLLKAAQSGDAAAEYYYWAREWNRAHDQYNQAFARDQTAAAYLTSEQQYAAEIKWKKAGDAEIKKAVAEGDKGAQMVAAELDVERAIDRAITNFVWLKNSADQRYPVAESDAAIRYLGMTGWMETKLDQKEGLKLLEQAANQDWPAAQYRLGRLYVAGELLPPDPSRAIKYFRMAADDGDPRSQFELAQLYAQGIGDPRNTADSPIALLRSSAAKGYYPALHALAERYRIGLGVSVDYVQAIRYYQAARDTDGGEGARSEDNSGDIFELVDKNLNPRLSNGPEWSSFSRVLSAYLKATQRGDEKAMSQLGEWYLNGQFMPQNTIAAYYWFTRAAEHGAASAVKERDTLRAELRPNQLEEAAKLYDTTP